VERLQQTILSEHWRIVFRRQSFTNRATLERSLRGFLQFYNFERPHHGYRVRGRTPATLFHGAPWPRLGNFMLHSGTAIVSTPTRVWTS
jgi:hypothetical protein